MKRVLADTGPLYALADPADRHHARAVEGHYALEHQGLISLVATPVLLEGYNLLLFRLGREAAQTWADELSFGSDLVNPTTDDYLAAVRRIGRYYDQSMTLTDGVIAELSERLATPVWTFDHHFDDMGVEVWHP